MKHSFNLEYIYNSATQFFLKMWFLTTMDSRLTSSQSLFLFGKWLQQLALLHFFFLGVMTLFRFASLWAYGQDSHWTWETGQAFVLGIRFDAAILGYFLVIPSLYLIFALHVRKDYLFSLFAKWIRPYYWFLFSLTCILLALDTQYYSYFQDHFNILVFGLIEDDTTALLKTFWKNYPVLWYLAFAVIGILLIGKLLQLTLKPVSRPGIDSGSVSYAALPVVSLVLVVFVFFMGRGSFGLFPIGPADTVISRDPFINHLPNNGIHALFRAFKLRSQQTTSWDNNLKHYGYADPKEAFSDFFQIPIDQLPESPLDLFKKTTPSNPWAEKTKPHVVVLMMESFGTYWLQYHSENFNLLGDLEGHLKTDIFLKNFLPSTGSTIGSLSSLMISAPQRPLGNFLTESQYLQVPFRSSPARVYSRAGYETRFIYGGNPGWRDVNKFARFQGFDHIEGDVDIEAKLGKLKEVHDWGVYDEDVFRYVMTLLKEAKKPQMILVMTTTNHPPYQVPSNFKVPTQSPPEELKSRFVGDPNIIESRFRTYYYSSQKLGEFLTELKTSELAEKTLLAATGDHGFLLVNFTDEELLQKWSTPFYLYAPKSLKVSLDPNTFGSHMDIFPTLYHLSLSNTEYDALGVNLLDPKSPHYAFHSTNLAVGAHGGALLTGKTTASFFDWQGDFEKLKPGNETPEKRAMVTRYRSLMSLMDYYFLSEKNRVKK